MVTSYGISYKLGSTLPRRPKRLQENGAGKGAALGWVQPARANEESLPSRTPLMEDGFQALKLMIMLNKQDSLRGHV